MTKKYRFNIFLTLMLLTTIAYADPIKRINSIKMNPSFIYGEATKTSANDAYDAALDILQLNIQQWFDNKGKTGRTLRDLTSLADTINARRGNYFRVFAFVPASKVDSIIKADADLDARARSGQRSTNNIHNGKLHSDQQTDKMLRDLTSKSSMQEFVAVIMQNKQDGIISDASRDISRQPSGCYLAVFNKTKKGDVLLYLLVPGKGQREDLISGQLFNSDLFIQNRDTYRFLWFVPTKTNQIN